MSGARLVGTKKSFVNLDRCAAQPIESGMKPVCSKCDTQITRHSKSGLCQSCSRSDPETVARRQAGRTRSKMINPHREAARLAKVVAANRLPERRQRSSELAREMRLWEHGLPKVTDEVRRRCAQTLSERKLSHIPMAYRDEYTGLVKKLGAKEAARIILEHAAKVAERAFA